MRSGSPHRSGSRSLRLYTNRRFTSNIDLYRRSGYALDGEEPYRDGFIVHMSKRLAAR